MKILLVVPRYSLANEANYEYTFPLGLAYISSVMKKAGHIVDCINLNHLAGKVKGLLEKKLDSERYDMVATGSNALSYKMIEMIIDTANNHNSNPITILGGPIITSEPSLIYNSLKPDFGVLGEGEETIVELLEYIKTSKEPQNVKGIIYKDASGNLVITEKRPNIKDLDSIPLPDFEGIGLQEQLGKIHTNYNSQGNMFDYPRMYPLLGSRSCPFQCTFCYHDSHYRRRSLNNIMTELREKIKKYQVNMIMIYDECFATDKKRLFEFCGEIAKLQKEISWELKWTCQLRVDSVDGEILKALKNSGCFELSYGFESYSPEVLKSMKKNITPEQIHKAFYDTMEAKIGVQANFIFGDVAETKETSKVTLDYFKNYGKGQIYLTFIQPYPGSEIYKHCVRKGIIKDKLEFVKNGIVPGRFLWLNMTDNMSDKEILKLKSDILNAQSKYLKYVVPKRMEKTGKDTYTVEACCPFCNKKIVYGNYFAANKISYGSFVVCRECCMRFFIVSPIEKLGFKYYKYIRPLIDFYKKTNDSISKANL